MKEKLLIHACCGPCSANPFNELGKDFDLLGFFSNSNIQPLEEYEKRLDSFTKISSTLKVEYFVDAYDPNDWNDAIKGLENEPERGERCKRCFEYRLRRSFEFAKNNKIKYISTTLTVAPYKDSKTVLGLGESLSKEYGVSFLGIDLKKNDGFKKTMALARKHGLYMQNYCGCIYSLKSREVKK
ncbi:MAG TPA: epoxyqueuosine reductase QueH [bacterium]|nr:epoxyqueuosine reductase QueH [bacterium]